MYYNIKDYWLIYNTLLCNTVQNCPLKAVFADKSCCVLITHSKLFKAWVMWPAAIIDPSSIFRVLGRASGGNTNVHVLLDAQCRKKHLWLRYLVPRKLNYVPNVVFHKVFVIAFVNMSFSLDCWCCAWKSLSNQMSCQKFYEPFGHHINTSLYIASSSFLSSHLCTIHAALGTKEQMSRASMKVRKQWELCFHSSLCSVTAGFCLSLTVSHSPK